MEIVPSTMKGMTYQLRRNMHKLEVGRIYAMFPTSDFNRD